MQPFLLAILFWLLTPARLRAAETIDPAGNATDTVDLRPSLFTVESRPATARQPPHLLGLHGGRALEFAVAKRQGHGTRLSVEFLNWAANQACGENEDGGFFSDLWKGFAAYGICCEDDMPYRANVRSSQPPSAARWPTPRPGWPSGCGCTGSRNGT